MTMIPVTLLASALGGAQNPAAEMAKATQEVIRRLDLTSFRNSVGPRRLQDRKSFADYGFTDVETSPSGATLYSADHGWMMRFRVLGVTASSIELCFSDRGLKRSGDAQAPSYDAQSALVVQRSAQRWWKAVQQREGFPGCQNTPPMRE